MEHQILHKLIITPRNKGITSVLVGTSVTNSPKTASFT
jgi:hypothetical protein